jgi:hypothetical protein
MYANVIIFYTVLSFPSLRESPRDCLIYGERIEPFPVGTHIPATGKNTHELVKLPLGYMLKLLADFILDVIRHILIQL